MVSWQETQILFIVCIPLAEWKDLGYQQKFAWMKWAKAPALHQRVGESIGGTWVVGEYTGHKNVNTITHNIKWHTTEDKNMKSVYYCLVHLRHVPPRDAALHQQYSTHTNKYRIKRENCSQFDTCPPLHAHLGLHLVGQCGLLVSEANVSLGERVCAGREWLYIEGVRSYQRDILYTSPSVSNTNRLTQHRQWQERVITYTCLIKLIISCC